MHEDRLQIRRADDEGIVTRVTREQGQRATGQGRKDAGLAGLITVHDVKGGGRESNYNDMILKSPTPMWAFLWSIPTSSTLGKPVATHGHVLLVQI